MTRRAQLPIACCALLLGAGGVARADLMGGSINIEVRVPDDNGGFVLPNPTDLVEFFNLASCVCGDEEFAVRLTLENAPASLPTQRVDIWVGNECDTDDPVIRREQCEQITTIDDVDTLRTPTTIPIPAHTLIAPNADVCPTRQLSRNVFAMIDDDGNEQTYETVFKTDPEIFVDTEAPPEPIDISVRGGESAVEASWDLPSARADDIFFFQLLCARADGTVSEDDHFPRNDPKYLTPRMLCGAEDGIVPVPPEGGIDSSSTAAPDAGPVADAGAVADAGPTPDGGVTPGSSFPPGLETLDPMTICAQASGTQSSIRASDLENGVPYRVVLVVADESLNATALDLGEVTPKPSVDFWEDYKDSGGNADGGFCFVATAAYDNYDHPYVLVLRDFRDHTLAHFAAGRAFIRWYYAHGPTGAAFLRRHPWARASAAVALFPLVVAAGTWEYTGPLGKLGLLLIAGLLFYLWRRRRRRKRSGGDRGGRGGGGRVRGRRARVVAGCIVVAIALAWAGAASAQPYWEELNEPVQKDVGPAEIGWTFELKVGPYYPTIDSEFNLAKDERGPFERMYGNGSLFMSQLELDRYFLHPYGQLGVGLMVGFLTKSANAFQEDGMGGILTDMDGNPLRSEGDSTTFRLIPTALSAVYRYTDLDDRFGIPLVPYGKLGLSYYIWSFTAPDGSIASAQKDPSCMPSTEKCKKSHAFGASLGYQASVGLLLRAERFDPGSEVALRQDLGIQHAGFFAELTYAKVDGFGASHKLSVGDLTWFGGINFEF